MTQILPDDSLRARLEAIGGRRRDRWLLAGGAAAVALVALLLWSRNAPASIAPPATATQAAPDESQATPAQGLLVHVAGAVRKPGLYELPAGARVADAVELAGAKAAADLDALNLAEPLIDGVKVLVPRVGEGPVAGASLPLDPTAPAVVDVNTANQPTLETIPGIGPVTAAAIIQLRTEAGPFTAIEDLLDVSGIGPATLESIRSYVTI